MDFDKEVSCGFGFIVLVIVLSILSDSFFTISNFLNILRQASFQAILAFGMTIVIISGGIDLSVGSILRSVLLYSPQY